MKLYLCSACSQVENTTLKAAKAAEDLTAANKAKERKEFYAQKDILCCFNL